MHMSVRIRFPSKLEHHSICAISLMQFDLSTGKDNAPLASYHAVQSGLNCPQLTRIQALVAAHFESLFWLVHTVIPSLEVVQQAEAV